PSPTHIYTLSLHDALPILIIFGCNLGYRFAVGREPVFLTINVQTPYMPITTNGKEPDLEEFVNEITPAVEAAAKKCQIASRSTPDRKSTRLNSSHLVISYA